MLDVWEVLKVGSPWTIIVVLGYVVRALHGSRERDRREHAKEKQELNDRLISMSEKQNEVLERATANQSFLLEAVRNTKLLQDPRDPVRR